MNVRSILRLAVLSTALLMLLSVATGVSVADTATDFPGFVSARGGQSYVLAIGDDGSLWGWGLSKQGRIVEQNNVVVPTPVKIESMSNVIAIDCFFSDAIALREDGTVWTWGECSYHFKNDNVGLYVPVQIPDLSSIRQVVCGQWFGVALKSDGTVWAWGSNDHGYLGDGTSVSSHYYTTPVQVPGISDVKLITSNGGTIFAVKADGTVWTWGATHAAMTGCEGVGKRLYTSTPVQIASLPGIVSCSANNEQLYLVTESGEVYRKDSNSGGTLTPDHVSGLQEIAKVDAGINHVVALGKNGDVYTWGKNDHGQLGDGTTKDRQTPYKVNISLVKAIFAGYYQTFAIDESGSVWGWGRDETGELGAGKSQARTLPVKASFNGSDVITPTEIVETPTVTPQAQTDATASPPASGPESGANIIMVLGCLTITALIARRMGRKE